MYVPMCMSGSTRRLASPICSLVEDLCLQTDLVVVVTFVVVTAFVLPGGKLDRSIL